MKDYVDELLSRLEQDYPEIFDELHGWSARRTHGDMRLEIERQKRFILRHMPTIWARVEEGRIVKQDVVNNVPRVFVQEKTIYHFRKGG